MNLRPSRTLLRGSKAFACSIDTINDRQMTSFDPQQLPVAGRLGFDTLIPFFPWARFFHDQGYIMPYPEVTLASEDAYARYTQMSGLLMTESWEPGNHLDYTIERPEEEGAEHFILRFSLSLDTISEVWDYLSVSEEQLRSYHLLSGLALVRKAGLLGQLFDCERIDPTTYRLRLK